METTEASKGISPRTWNAIALGALLIAIALGLILYWITDDPLNTFGAILLVFGIYVAVSSFYRKGGESNFGPSDADAALAAGTIVAGVGVVCFVYSFSGGEVLITAAVLIIIVAVVGIAMAVKNRNVRR